MQINERVYEINFKPRGRNVPRIIQAERLTGLE
jgi:hypothetical protein